MRWLAALGVVAGLAGTSAAGRTPFAWSYGTDIIPERGLELESWINEENQKDGSNTGETSFWWGPVLALTEHVEFAISMEAHDEAGSTSFERWGADVRYRPQSPD